MSAHPENYVSVVSGAVTRLSENGPEDLEELWELLASAWSRFASKQLVDQLDVDAAKATATARPARRSRRAR